jgi:hypothetical protein
MSVVVIKPDYGESLLLYTVDAIRGECAILMAYDQPT